MPRRYNNSINIQTGNSGLPGIPNIGAFLQQQEAFKQRLALQQQRQQATQSRQEILQREAMNRALLMQQIKQQEARQKQEIGAGLTDRNSQMSQARAHQYAQIMERVKTGEISQRDVNKALIELGILPQQEQIKRESEIEKRRQLVPIEVGQKVQEQDILGPKRTQEEVSKKTALNKVFDPLTDTYHKGVSDVTKDMMNPDYASKDPDLMNQKRQLLLQKLTEGALASNDPRIK
jgi:hypothetical protein